MIKKIVIYFSYLGALIIVFFFFQTRPGTRPLKNMSVLIEDNTDLRFANEKSIRTLIPLFKDLIEKKPIKKIEFSLIEKKIKNLDFIQKVQIDMDLDSILKIYIQEKQPIARIKIALNSYYLTPECVFINPCPWYHPSVLLVEGFFLKNDIQILKWIIQYILNNPLLQDHIIGIQKLSSKSLNFIIKKGKYTIQMVDFSNYKEKLFRLQAFYNQYMDLLHEQDYKEIHLQYAGQVIAKKI